MTRKFNCIFPRDPARRATEILKPSQQSQPYNSLQNERIQNEREEKKLITPAISSINRSSNVFFAVLKHMQCVVANVIMLLRPFVPLNC